MFLEKYKKGTMQTKTKQHDEKQQQKPNKKNGKSGLKSRGDDFANMVDILESSEKNKTKNNSKCENIKTNNKSIDIIVNDENGYDDNDLNFFDGCLDSDSNDSCTSSSRSNRSYESDSDDSRDSENDSSRDRQGRKTNEKREDVEDRSNSTNIRSKRSSTKNTIKGRKRNGSDSNKNEISCNGSHTHGRGSSSYNELKDENESDKLDSKTNVLLDHEKTWGDLNLSRQLLMGLNDIDYELPSLIQSACIPAALRGRDILANAQTGSGKTAAFLLPMIERLIQSPGVRARQMTPSGPVGGLRGTKGLILVPTRELAMQCIQMLKTLSKYTTVTSALACGGMTLKDQENSIRCQPDIVVATPGRILDLLLNSSSIHMTLLEMVVLDEADRLLELGFRDEILQILKHCHRSRQTMLFSATLNSSISSLALLALTTPLHISCHTDTGMAASASEGNGRDMVLDLTKKVCIKNAAASQLRSISIQLQQQFVELQNEEQRIAALIDLCNNDFNSNVIIFFPTKKLAHETFVLFNELGFACAELHGNLTQQKRIEALDKFHSGEARLLLASELASRGLDIAGVKGVINFVVPSEISRYVHCVGRTARMGRSGVAATLFVRGSADEKAQVKRIITMFRYAGLDRRLR